MCLAVAETAIVAVGAAVALGASMRRPWGLAAVPLAPQRVFAAPAAGVRARAGPPLLQSFRL
jgi:hypothetical protein